MITPLQFDVHGRDFFFELLPEINVPCLSLWCHRRRKEENFKMWDKRKLLLAAIIFIALYDKVTARRAKVLDMAPDAVDDVYKGCRKQALETFIHSDLLKQELNHSEGFQRAWSRNTPCSHVIPGGTAIHTAALLAYANGDAEFIQTFNDAVETLGVNVSIYKNHFNFKSLHFLLMDSMTLQHPKKCKTVFALPEKKYKATKGSRVRFGQFIMAHSSYDVLQKLEDWDGQVLFNITSCLFVNMGNNICNDEDIVLLSPAEVFTVEEVKEITDPNESEYTEVILKHSQVDSMHNCYIFSRSPAHVSTQWLVLVFAASSLFSFNNK